MNVQEYFDRLTPEQLEKIKAHYELLIAEAKGDIQTKGIRMTWMLPHWEAGLLAIKSIIDERNNRATGHM